MKRTKTFLFAMLLVAAQMMPFTVKAEEEILTSGDFECEIHDDATVWITKYLGSETELEIPETINGFTVTAIGDMAFSYCSDLTSVKIPDSVTAIGMYAFYNCSSLISINIPDGVTTIEYGEFSDCSSLAEIEIPDGVTAIETCAFYECSNLNSVNIPNSVTTIEYEAFSGCSSLNDLEIPESVTSIEALAFLDTAYYADDENWSDGVLYLDNWLIRADADEAVGSCIIQTGTEGIAASAFAGCSGLTSIDIPSSIMEIGENAFYNCNGLQTITVAADNQYYSATDGILFSKDESELVKYPAEKDGSYYQIPSSVKTIWNYAFQGCSNLTDIEIPDSITSIGYRAFESSAYYEDEENWSDGLLYIGEWLIDSDKEIASGVYAIKTGTVGIGSYALYGCTDLTSIVLPDSLMYINDYVKCTPLSRQIFLNFKLDFGGVIEAQSTPSLPSLGYPLSVDI